MGINALHPAKAFVFRNHVHGFTFQSVCIHAIVSATVTTENAVDIKIAADTLLTMQAAAPVAPEPAMAGDGEAPPEPQEDTVVGIDVALLKGTMDVHGIDLVVDKLPKKVKLRLQGQVRALD